MTARARPALLVAAKLQLEALRIDAHLARVEDLHDSGDLEEPDLMQAYSGALLRWTTTLERRLEQLVLGLLAGTLVVNGGRVKPLLVVGDAGAAEMMLLTLTGRRSLDWLPVDRTAALAKSLFDGGRPFDLLEPADRRAGADLHVTRNAVAHRSGRAMRAFRNEVVRDKPLPAAQKTPIGYLRGPHQGTQHRISYLIAQSTASIVRLASARPPGR